MLGLYRRPLVVALLAISWIGAVACGDDDDPTPSPPAAAGEGGDGGSGTGTGGGGKGGSNPAGGAGGEGQPGEPGIRTVGVAPLRTSESGGQETFAIVLEARPTANVTIPLESSNEDEGTVAPGSVTFTPANWNAPQVITVTGVDDDDADGDTAYTIEVGPAQSSDGSYDGLEGDAVELTNTDDETAGITVDADTDLTTSEGGGQATFRVVLNAAPSADVRIPLASDDVGEGTVTPVFLLFTPQNWNAPKVVTIHGVDDAQKDGDQEYSIVLAAAESSDSNYDGLNADDVSLTNIDNETAGVTLDFGAGLSTSEDGGDATFRIALNAQPTANVTFSLESSDEGEGLAAPTSITFTPANWNAPQVITVTGVDDDEVDGPQPYTIEIGSATSSDSAYSGLAGGSVPVLNEDDETAGVELQGVGALQTSEAGGDASFTVRLRAQPGANVTLRLTSSDTGEGVVTPGSLVFTPANWDAPRTVTISGVDDDLDDGNQVYTIVTAALTSSDPNYDGIGVLDLTVTNIDNDTPGITVFPLEATTTEAGGDDTFRVVLNSEPTANVTIQVESGDDSEGEVSPGTLTFTPANWDAPQFVTVTGLNDDLDDGNQVYFVELLPAESTDIGYDGEDGTDVELTNTDDETAGITVDPVAGLTTTEAGDDAEFTVVLNSEPTANVTITLSSSDPDEGTPDETTLIFTPGNWDAPQTITVTGEDDDLDDGNQTYTIEVEAATSDDDNYDGEDGTDVELTNTDDETAGITVDPVAGLTTTEAGDDAEFTVVLNSEPTANVTITLSSSDPDEGTPDETTLIFTPGDWDTPQIVTVTGEDDLLDDGDQLYTIEVEEATSDDVNYDGEDGTDVELSNTDNDPVAMGGISVNPTSGLESIEGEFDDSFSIVLTSAPTGNVTINFSVTMGSHTVEASPPSVTFTTMNWNTPQNVLAWYLGDPDSMDDPFVIDLLPATSTDLAYNGVDGGSVSGMVLEGGI
jgi:large repetitive protein